MLKSKAFITLLVLLIFGANANAQTEGLDSLQATLSSAQGAQKVDVLNQLTYAYITNDSVKVKDYNRRAVALATSIGYTAGHARALTYRGVAAYLSGQLDSGHKSLNEGLALAKKANDRKLIGYTYLQLGNCSLEEVQMDSAMIFFKQSRAIFKEGTDPATLSKLYRNISVLYGQRYQIDSQQFYLDKAIDLRRQLPGKALLIEVLAMKADLNRLIGDVQAAEKYTADARRLVSDAPDDEEFSNDVRRLEALLLFAKGNFDEASALFDSARSFFVQKGLVRKYVTLLIDVSRVFTDRGDYEIALNNLYDALNVSQQHHFDAETTIIRIQIGWINHYLGNSAYAVQMAEEAMQRNPHKLLRNDLAAGLTLKGVALIDLKKFNAARICLDSVLHIYEEYGSRQGLSEANMYLGDLASQRGAYAPAMAQYSSAITIAETIPNDLVLARAYRGRGDARFHSGSDHDALTDLDRAEHYARKVAAKEVLAAVYKSKRDLLMKQGKHREALGFSILADQLYDSLHNADIAKRFVNLEKLQEIEQQNHDIQLLRQEKLLAENKIQLQSETLKKQSVMLIAGLIGSLLLGMLAFAYYRFYEKIKLLNVSVTDKNKRIEAQSDKLQEVNKELSRLYSEVSAQKQEIQYQASELTESHQRISKMNQDLEQMVAEKTIELRRINEELIKNNSELLQFSFTVSHNLRGPVARLMGLASLVARHELSEEARQLVGFISMTADELDQIIRDLVNILELRNHPQRLREPINLQHEWSQTLGLLEEKLTGKEQFSTDFNKLPEIYSVRSVLDNVLYHLVSNSPQYRSLDRELQITATSHVEDGRAVLEVRDNGLGFSTQAHKDKLFKLYRRFHAHVGGRGMGLYLIKTQIEVLHGTVEALSEPDQGALFRVRLPLNGEDHP